MQLQFKPNGDNMKKFIILAISLISISSNVFAYEYSQEFKKGFYDSFIANLFGSLKESLFSQDFKPNSVNEYVATMRTRLDRNELEKETWGCVSKYTPEEMEKNTDKIVTECFEKWNNEFFFVKNQNVIDILKR